MYGNLLVRDILNAQFPQQKLKEYNLSQSSSYNQQDFFLIVALIYIFALIVIQCFKMKTAQKTIKFQV